MKVIWAKALNFFVIEIPELKFGANKKLYQINSPDIHVGVRNETTTRWALVQPNYLVKSKIFFIIILFFSFQFAFAQKTIHVQNVTGISYLSDDITLNQTKEKALEEAKKDALRKAGVAEHISESNVLYSLSQEKDFKQFFNSISTIEISGAITKTENIRYEKKVDRTSDKEFIEATIDAEVIKYEKKSDPSFDFEESGIIGKYKENEHINFSLKTSADGFLKIFVIKDKSADLIYPNKYEKDNLIAKNKVLEFPTNKGIEYGFENISQNESQLILIIFTKKNVPFFKEINYENIINWIYSISPDERRLKSFLIMVTK